MTAVCYTTVAFMDLLDAGNKRAASPDEPTSQVITVKPIVLCDRVAKIRGVLGQWDRGSRDKVTM